MTTQHCCQSPSSASSCLIQLIHDWETERQTCYIVAICMAWEETGIFIYTYLASYPITLLNFLSKHYYLPYLAKKLFKTNKWRQRRRAKPSFLEVMITTITYSKNQVIERSKVVARNLPLSSSTGPAISSFLFTSSIKFSIARESSLSVRILVLSISNFLNTNTNNNYNRNIIQLRYSYLFLFWFPRYESTKRDFQI